MTVPRISAIQQGGLAPLYGGTPPKSVAFPGNAASLNPIVPARPTLGHASDSGQVLSLFLEPVGVRHSAEGSPSSRIGIPANSTVISMRGRTGERRLAGPCPNLGGTRSPTASWPQRPRRCSDDEGFELTPNPGVQGCPIVGATGRC